MDIRLITPERVGRHEVADLPDLLAREDGVLWVDIPEGDPDAVRGARARCSRFHPKAVQDCIGRSPVPKVHVYADHVFVVLHAPEAGAGGHVHYVELDQFIGQRYLVTVHGPVNVAVDPAAARVETDLVAARVDGGRLVPPSGLRAVDGGRLGADRPDARPHQFARRPRCGASSSR